MKVRRKALVLDAVQWKQPGDHPKVVEPRAMNSIMVDDIGLTDSYSIETLEGWVRVRAGDYIMTGVAGEHWPIRYDIFWATYELVEDDVIDAEFSVMEPT